MSLSQTINCNNSSQFVIPEPTKIDIDAVTNARLKLIDLPDQEFVESFDSDTGFTYDSDKAEFTGGQVQQKNKKPTDAMSGASYSTSLNLEAWSGGVVTGNPVGGASIVGGRLDLTGGITKNVVYDADLNADSQQTGCIRFKWIPNYSGAPSGVNRLFTIQQSAASSNNRIWIYHTSTLLFWQIMNSTGGTIVSQAESFSPTAGTEYEVELNWDVTTGATRLFINGVQLSSTNINTGTRSSNIGYMRVGQETSDFYFDDLIYFSTVQHTTNYTPGYTVPINIYEASNVTLPEMHYTGTGTLQALQSVVTSQSGTPKWRIQIGQSGDWLYWNGSAWTVVSDITDYAQANDITTFNTNVPSLDIEGEVYGQFQIIFPDSNTVQSSVSNLIATVTGQTYPTDNPYFRLNTNVVTIRADQLFDFVESVTKAGNDDVRYVLLRTGLPVYYNTTTGEWETSDYSLAKSNTAAEILQGKESFLTDGYGKILGIAWVLHSDDGTTTPEAESVEIEYDFSAEPPTLTEALFYSYSYLFDSDPNANPITVSPGRILFGTNSIIWDTPIDVTVFDNGGFEAIVYYEDDLPDNLLWTFSDGRIITTNFLEGTNKFSQLTIEKMENSYA